MNYHKFIFAIIFSTINLLSVASDIKLEPQAVPEPLIAPSHASITRQERITLSVSVGPDGMPVSHSSSVSVQEPSPVLITPQQKAILSEKITAGMICYFSIKTLNLLTETTNLDPINKMVTRQLRDHLVSRTDLDSDSE